MRETAAGVLGAAILLAGMPAVAQDGLRLIDSRADKPAETKMLSFNAVSCGYSVFKIADLGRPVDRMTRLRADLERELGSELAGKSVQVIDYQIYLNSSRRAKRLNGQAHGLIGVAISQASTTGCDKETDRQGWYAADEVSNNFSPLVVQIAVTVDGRPLAVRSVISPKAELRPADRIKFLVVDKETWNQTDKVGAPEVDAAFTMANQLLIDEIREAAGPQSAEPTAAPAPAPG
jgi:hypothetical protein